MPDLTSPAFARTARPLDEIPHWLPLYYNPPAMCPPSPEAAQGAGIDLGTAVLVSLCGNRSCRQMTEEGVVIEVVAPDQEIQSARVVRLRTPIADDERYVIQCWTCRVLRFAHHLVVVSL